MVLWHKIKKNKGTAKGLLALLLDFSAGESPFYLRFRLFEDWGITGRELAVSPKQAGNRAEIAREMGATKI